MSTLSLRARHCVENLPYIITVTLVSFLFNFLYTICFCHVSPLPQFLPDLTHHPISHPFSPNKQKTFKTNQKPQIRQKNHKTEQIETISHERKHPMEFTWCSPGRGAFPGKWQSIAEKWFSLSHQESITKSFLARGGAWYPLPVLHAGIFVWFELNADLTHVFIVSVYSCVH